MNTRRVLVGLGNPEEQYQKTWHNLGFNLVDALAGQGQGAWTYDKKLTAWISGGPLANTLLVKPATYMNRSGLSVGKLVNYYKISVEDLVIAYDDVGIPAFEVKLSQNKSPAGHNGLADVIRTVGQGFAQFRIGIGPKPPGRDLKDYVLSRIPASSWSVFEKKLPEMCQQMMVVLDKGAHFAMNITNRKAGLTQTKDSVQKKEADTESA